MTIIAEIDATGWAVIIGASCVGVGGIVTSVVSLVISYADRKRLSDREDAKIERERIAAEKVEAVRVQAATAAKAVNEVKTSLAESTEATANKLDAMAKVSEDTHSLVNSAMLEQKRMFAAKCKASAEDKPTAANIAEAKVAQEVYEEHKKKQESMENKR